jgi:hypothetical protein
MSQVSATYEFVDSELNTSFVAYSSRGNGPKGASESLKCLTEEDAKGINSFIRTNIHGVRMSESHEAEEGTEYRYIVGKGPFGFDNCVQAQKYDWEDKEWETFFVGGLVEFIHKYRR